MAAQGLVTVLGYIFWIIVARLYDSAAVGIAGTLISVAMLISQISILGLNNAIVRFLPTAKDKNEKINTCLVIVSGASLLAAVVYALAMPVFSPSLLFIRDDPVLLGLFLISMVLVALNTFTDSVFLANRATKYNIAVYGGYSLLRVALPFAFVSFGTVGIFGAHIAGIALAVILSFYFMVTRLGYRFALSFNKQIARMISGYSAASYVAGFLWMAPLLMAPLLVIHQLGAEPAAHFYMVNTIVSCLLIIPLATTQSLFAEGSHAEDKLFDLTKRSLKLCLTLVGLGVVGLFALGKPIITVFGEEYAHAGINLLYLLAATTLLVAVNMTANSVLKVRRQNWLMIGINLTGALVMIVGFQLFMQRHGLIGIGYGYLVGHATMLALFGGLFTAEYLFARRKAIAVSTTS